MKLLDREELATYTGLNLDQDPLLVTYHPVTLEYQQAETQVRQLLGALQESGLPMVFTMPNADTNGRLIKTMIEDFVKSCSRAQMVDNLGTLAYFSMMRFAAAMVGNSSSGIVEAPSFGLPVVNIGNRQGGRKRAQNVIDVGNSQEEITEGIQMAVAPDFHWQLEGMANPYGDGDAAEMIVSHLKEQNLDQQLIVKHFMDAPAFFGQSA
jgi:UDP-hydrolysing UDP-N-acetyl-D-glucosamine 2-epimerase